MNRQQNAAAYFLHQGTNYKAYEYLGAHRVPYEGYVFRVWAPEAAAVSLVGDFCGWDTGTDMHRVTEGGVWEVRLPEHRVSQGDKYKYRITAKGGTRFLRADPYSFECERQPSDASVVSDLGGYVWRDASYLSARRSAASADMSIYELDLGSWLSGEGGEQLGYARIATELSSYVKQLGCTHIALTDAYEYIYDGSGFEPYSYFAPTARFGRPYDFMSLVDSMHEAGVGVIIDFNISTFPVRALGRFDGSALYECERGLPRFALARREVECFLVSSLTLWLDKYHIDGLYLTGLTSFLSSARDDGRLPETLLFFRELNMHIKEAFPDALLLADDAGFVGKSALGGRGLGFDILRSTQWTTHAPAYFTHPTRERTGYRISEAMKGCLPDSTLLALSATDVGERPIMSMVSGTGEEQLAQLRALLGHMFTYRGHKLYFMGTEIGDARAWSRESGVNWHLLDDERNARLQLYTAELGQLFLSSEALREGETEQLPCEQKGLMCYIRKKGEERLLTVVNFSEKNYEKFFLEVPASGAYEEIFNSDDRRYGGNGRTNGEPLVSAATEGGVYKNAITISIPPLATILFKLQPKKTQD